MSVLHKGSEALRSSRICHHHPQNTPLWYVDCFKLKTTERKKENKTVYLPLNYLRASLIAELVKNLPAMQESPV